mmetsp:Transcript_106428/g.254088  ORF Transcript_106428/g.254088 Transcript_106428/m.254088 type:complete len:256 (+) Transcript_106428:846-1613(+)
MCLLAVTENACQLAGVPLLHLRGDEVHQGLVRRLRGLHGAQLQQRLHGEAVRPAARGSAVQEVPGMQGQAQQVPHAHGGEQAVAAPGDAFHIPSQVLELLLEGVHKVPDLQPQLEPRDGDQGQHEVLCRVPNGVLVHDVLLLGAAKELHLFHRGVVLQQEVHLVLAQLAGIHLVDPAQHVPHRAGQSRQHDADLPPPLLIKHPDHTLPQLAFLRLSLLPPWALRLRKKPLQLLQVDGVALAVNGIPHGVAGVVGP